MTTIFETAATPHISVMLPEVLEGLQCDRPGRYVDCTVGGGGHTAAILTQHSENQVLGIDRDERALQFAKKRLAPFGKRVELHHQRFEAVDEILAPDDVFDGALLDLGVSSLQFDDAERGFSFQKDGWLDMRMDQQKSQEYPTKSAYEVVNTYAPSELIRIFFQYGEERFSKRIVQRIVSARTAQAIETTTQLAEIVAQAVPKKFHKPGLHPATKIFQAIRIEVNDELRQLGEALERLVLSLRTGGRICVISFHSLEDRIVKRTFVKLAKGCQCPPDFPQCVCGIRPSLKIVTRKPLTASEMEKRQNPRSRSAKLRIAEKL